MPCGAGIQFHQADPIGRDAAVSEAEAMEVRTRTFVVERGA